jgi:hypothetical protein
VSKIVQLFHLKISDTQSKPLPVQGQYQQPRRPKVLLGCTVLQVPVYTVLSIYGLKLDGMEQPPNSDDLMKSVNAEYLYYISNYHLSTLIIPGAVDTQGFEMATPRKKKISCLKRHYLCEFM